MHNLLMLTLIVGLVLLIVAHTVSLALRAVKSTRSRAWIVNASISLSSLLIMALALEIALAFFHVRSDFNSYTYAARRWWGSYWKPVNEYGFRDRPLTRDDQRYRIAIVGDSIVAGQGIDDVEDRFSNFMESHCAGRFRVYNVAKCGWSTQEQLDFLPELLRVTAPHSVILVYYPNDFEAIHVRNNPDYKKLVPLPRGVVYQLTQTSALFSWVYWRIHRLRYPDLGQRYWDLMETAARDTSLMRTHRQELERFIELVKSNNASLTVVLMPVVPSMEVGNSVLDAVENIFLEHDVPVVRLENDLRRIAPEQRIVNPNDAHPSVAAHRIIGEALIERLHLNPEQTASGQSPLNPSER